MRERSACAVQAREPPFFVRGKNDRMDVALATDRRRIAELLRYGLNAVEHLLARFVRGVRALTPQELECFERCEPRPEVLRRERAAGSIAQVVIHIARPDAPALAVFVEPLEELLPGNILAVAHDARDRSIRHRRAVRDAALSPKLENERAA